MTEIDPNSTDLTIDFDTEAFTGAEATKVPNLEALDLQCIRADYAMPRELLSCAKLKKLELSPNGDDELVIDPLVSELPALEELHLVNVAWAKSAAALRNPRVRAVHVTQCDDLAATLEALSGMPQLVTLHIDGNSGETGMVPAAIGRFTALEDLALTDLGVDAFPPEMKNLTKLKSLRLSSGKTPASIGTLTSLENLDLYGNEIDDLAPLAPLTNLKKLRIRGQLKSLAPIVSLSALEDLDLMYSRNVEDFTPLTKLPKLRVLDVSGCNLKRADFLLDMPALKRLSAEDNKLSALSVLFKPPLIDRLELEDPGERDPDEDEDDVGDVLRKFRAARALAKLPSLDTIVASLANAYTADAANVALEQALAYADATSTPKQRTLGTLFGDARDEKPAARDDDDADDELDEDEEEEEHDEDEDEDEDERPRKKQKGKQPPPPPIALASIEKIVAERGHELSDAVLLHLFKATFRKRTDNFPIAPKVALLLVERKQTHDALAGVIAHAMYDWKKRPRTGSPHDRIVEEVIPRLSAKALVRILDECDSDMLPERGDGLLKYVGKAFAGASAEDAQSLAQHINDCLDNNRRQVPEAAVKQLVDDARAAGGAEHKAIVDALAERNLGWFGVDKDLRAAIGGKKQSAPVSADAANARVLSLGRPGGLPATALDDHAETLAQLMSGDKLSLEAQIHLVRFAYAKQEHRTHLVQQALVNILKRTGVNGLSDALAPLVDIPPAKRETLLEDLLGLRDRISDVEGVTAEDIENLTDKTAQRTPEEGRLLRARKKFSDDVDDISDDDKRDAWFAAADLIKEPMKVEDSWSLSYAVENLLDEKPKEALRVIDHLPKMILPRDDKERLLAALVKATVKANSPTHRGMLLPHLPPLADVKEEDLAIALAIDAAHEKDRALLLEVCAHAVKLGASEYQFEDDYFGAFKKDPEFKKAIGRDDDGDDDSGDDAEEEEREDDDDASGDADDSSDSSDSSDDDDDSSDDDSSDDDSSDDDSSEDDSSDDDDDAPGSKVPPQRVVVPDTAADVVSAMSNAVPVARSPFAPPGVPSSLVIAPDRPGAHPVGNAGGYAPRGGSDSGSSI